VKPAPEEKIEPAVYEKTVSFFEELMQLLHPFMPFVTEDVYHLLKERKEGDDIIVKQLPTGNWQMAILNKGNILKEDITAIRDVKKRNEIKNNEKIKFRAAASTHALYAENPDFRSILEKQINGIYSTPSPGMEEEYSKKEITVVSSNRTLLLYIEKEIDKSKQKEELLKDLAYQKGFLESVEKKLGNERFVQNAKPEIVETERKKKADAEAKIKAIEQSLEAL
jgi:valyl-tRNA synthetase